MAGQQVIFVPAPGIGHLISTVEFAKRLLSGSQSGRLSATVLVMPPHPAWAATTAAYIDSVSPSLSIHFKMLPPVNFRYLPGQNGITILTRLAESYKPLINDYITDHLSSAPSPAISAIILDFFCTSIIDIADAHHIPAYIYYTSGAAMLGTTLYLPTLDINIPCELEDAKEAIDIPGFAALVPAHSMPEVMMNKKDEAYAVFVEHGRRFRETKGIIVNTFVGLEPMPIRAVEDGLCLPDHPTPPVYAVGPVLAMEMEKVGPARHECVEWLDSQPLGSVVFLCFGSIGSFGEAQARELAVGLERSGVRFLWVLRSPPRDGSRMPVDADLDEVLPEGFLERTKERGLVWPSWVPQVEILGNSAVGGFVTHCGWNSVLESLWYGVPMLGWPLYAEQRLNCFDMVKEMGVAVELKLEYSEGGFVNAEEVKRGVRCLMEDCEEGKKVRAKVEEMKVGSRQAVEKGGSSYEALRRLIGELETKGENGFLCGETSLIGPPLVSQRIETVVVSERVVAQ